MPMNAARATETFSEKLMLEKLLNVGDDHDVLEWCFQTLEPDEIDNCLQAATEIAKAEIGSDDAATMLTAVFVKTILRGLRWARLERQRGESNLEGRRNQLAADVLQQVGNQVQATLLLHAPATWSDDRLDGIELQVLERTRLALDKLSDDDIQSASALQLQIAKAVAETERLVSAGGVR
ncbi:hypothetical protein [Paludibaculum fermentans]|uniref:hypothetical protein n=1 Tax=Paludibaculum fermentans TaxID=1473598 RepID=UPI003EBBF73E